MCPVLFHLEIPGKTRDKHLEREVLRYKEQVSALQGRLDSVTKVRDEELNNKLFHTSVSCMISVCYPVFSTS